MKKLLLATAALIALSLPASAAVIGTFGVNPTSAAGAFSNDPNGPGVGGLFTDDYTFELIGGPQFVTVATASNTFALGGITGPHHELCRVNLFHRSRWCCRWRR
jgi:hypothetical protein